MRAGVLKQQITVLPSLKDTFRLFIWNALQKPGILDVVDISNEEFCHSPTPIFMDHYPISSDLPVRVRASDTQWI